MVFTMVYHDLPLFTIVYKGLPVSKHHGILHKGIMTLIVNALWCGIDEAVYDFVHNTYIVDLPSGF